MNTHTDKTQDNKSQLVANVVQQKQGRVKSTFQMQGIVNINDDERLGREADVMGAKALQMKTTRATYLSQNLNTNPSINPGHTQREQPVQRLMKKLGVDKANYQKMCMNKVYLYAEFNGKSLGVYSTEKGDHAEEKLIEHIIENGLNNGKLVVYLSTRLCYSVMCSREDGKKGCQERLERLKSYRKIEVVVHADQLYQPQF